MGVQAEILKRLSQYLSDALSGSKLILSRNAKDGRINSQENEREISQALEYHALSNEWFKRKKLSEVQTISQAKKGASLHWQA